MTKHRKLITLLLASVILSGCSLFNSDTESGVINTVDLNQSGEIRGADASSIIIWGLFEKEENVKPLIDRFKSSDEAYSSFNIEYVEKDKEDYLTELNSVLTDGNPNTTPDIFMLHSSWLENYTEYTLNATDSIIPEKFMDDMHGFVKKDLYVNGKARGLPLWVDLLAMVYNKKHVIDDSGSSSISQDWGQFKIQTQNMTKRDESGKITRAGFSAASSENVEFGFEIIDLLFMQARNYPISESDVFLPFNESEKGQVKEAIDWYRGFVYGSDATWGKDFKKDTAMFIEGGLSTIVLPSWRILDILDLKEKYSLDLDFDVSVLPQLNSTDENKVYYPSYWIFVVSSDTKNFDSSWRLLKFMLEKSEQEFYRDTVETNGRAFSLLSPRSDVAANQAEQVPLLKPYYDSIAGAQSWRMPNSEKFRSTYLDLLSNESDLDQVLTLVKSLNETKGEL